MNNQEVKKALENLWFNIVAVKNESDEAIKEKIRSSISLAFEQLDKLNVPFVIQNQVIAIAEMNISFQNNINVILGGF